MLGSTLPGVGGLLYNLSFSGGPGLWISPGRRPGLIARLVAGESALVRFFEKHYNDKKKESAMKNKFEVVISIRKLDEENKPACNSFSYMVTSLVDARVIRDKAKEALVRAWWEQAERKVIDKFF